MAVKRRTFQSLWLPISLILFSIFSLFLFLTFRLGISSGAAKERNIQQQKKTSRLPPRIQPESRKSTKDSSTQYEHQGPLPPPDPPQLNHNNFNSDFGFNSFVNQLANQPQFQQVYHQPIPAYQTQPIPAYQTQSRFPAQPQVIHLPPPVPPPKIRISVPEILKPVPLQKPSTIPAPNPVSKQLHPVPSVLQGLTGQKAVQVAQKIQAPVKPVIKAANQATIHPPEVVKSSVKEPVSLAQTSSDDSSSEYIGLASLKL